MLHAPDHFRGPLLHSVENSLSFLNCRMQNWTQYSRFGLTRTGRRGRITSLNLPAVFLLIYLKIPLTFLVTSAHCWLMVKLLSTMIFRSFSAELLPAAQPVACMVVSGYMQDSMLALVELHKILLCPNLQSEKALFNGSTAFWCAS